MIVPSSRLLAAALVAACALALAPRAVAQDAPPAEDADAPAPAEKSSGLKGIRKGTSRVSLFGGWRLGQTAKSLDVLATPLISAPVNMRIEMDDSAFGGLGYSYQWHDKWAFEASWSLSGTSLENPEKFDRAYTESILAQSAVPLADQAPLVDRLESHAGPYDLDVSTLDLGVTRVFSPKSRWVAEAGAGIGWGWGKLGTSPAIYEQLVHSIVEPMSGDLYVIANETVDGTMGQDCPADNDPCIKLEDGGGLTFHAVGGVSYAFTDHVHLRMAMKVRYLQRVVDPGDSLVTVDSQLGLSFLWGGD